MMRLHAGHADGGGEDEIPAHDPAQRTKPTALAHHTNAITASQTAKPSPPSRAVSSLSMSESWPRPRHRRQGDLWRPAATRGQHVRKERDGEDSLQKNTQAYRAQTPHRCEPGIAGYHRSASASHGQTDNTTEAHKVCRVQRQLKGNVSTKRVMVKTAPNRACRCARLKSQANADLNSQDTLEVRAIASRGSTNQPARPAEGSASPRTHFHQERDAQGKREGRFAQLKSQINANVDRVIGLERNAIGLQFIRTPCAVQDITLNDGPLSGAMFVPDVEAKEVVIHDLPAR
ncbi:hypothetical protein CERZMDRAFT_81176 [Cercospora zeae-maydis SCOH1-5]|uniref:Uncharacterized protein n=1 Tax=Cercospora zeae-maydis SCOH1-5 TaxID=717836 RepID=A0A6A6FUY2_9PEZI|nr:hypothetical protein CERZMDRAFT_81176 [Cercospora zeae-maydis SCOH1-5]